MPVFYPVVGAIQYFYVFFIEPILYARAMTTSSSEDQRHGPGRVLTLNHDLQLDSGQTLTDVQIAYETYGCLNEQKNNTLWICHALTMDQYVASNQPVTGKPGWWSRLIGPGRVFDTRKYFIVCANVLGSCMGSTGPKEINPATGRHWGMDFPVITLRDMVRAQIALLDHMQIPAVLCVIGGSMGGMQALEWAADYGDRVHSVISIASTARHSAQNIAFHEVGRQAIMADPHWRGGDYYGQDDQPRTGLAVARMAAHITYMSEEGLTRRFDRRLQSKEDFSFGFDADFQVESYLRHQGISFVERFDANSYLYITRAMDYFDIAEERSQKLGGVYSGSTTHFCLISFDSDWLYPTEESRIIARALNAAMVPVSFCELSSPHGHDSFLLECPDMDRILDGFVSARYRERAGS